MHKTNQSQLHIPVTSQNELFVKTVLFVPATGKTCNRVRSCLGLPVNEGESAYVWTALDCLPCFNSVGKSYYCCLYDFAISNLYKDLKKKGLKTCKQKKNVQLLSSVILTLMRHSISCSLHPIAISLKHGNAGPPYLSLSGCGNRCKSPGSLCAT